MVCPQATRGEIEKKNFDIKIVNPNAKSTEDMQAPEELLEIIGQKGREVAEILQQLKAKK